MTCRCAKATKNKSRMRVSVPEISVQSTCENFVLCSLGVPFHAGFFDGKHVHLYTVETLQSMYMLPRVVTHIVIGANPKPADKLCKRIGLGPLNDEELFVTFCYCCGAFLYGGPSADRQTTSWRRRFPSHSATRDRSLGFGRIQRDRA